MSLSRISRIAALLLVLVTGTTGCGHNSGPSESEAEFWERMEAFVTERMDPAGSGFGFVAIHDGDVGFARGWGMANVEAAVPFTAVAVLILHERGLVTLQTPLGSIFPEFPAAWSEIPVHQLLIHRSGIPNYVDITGTDPQDIDGLTNQAVLDLVLADPILEFTPGSSTAYCNTGYLILAMLVERLTGESFADFLQVEIFEPLGMSSTFVRQESTEYPPGVAQPYDEQNRRYEYALHVYGPTGIYSTLNDYFKWDQALYTDQIVSQSTLRRAFTGYTGGQNNFGYGWMVGTRGLFPSYRHGGFTTGFLNYVYRVPDLGFTYMFLSNGGVFANGGFNTWTNELMESIFDFYM
jgi:CubicO group peptidase (beta-lactamase class C family)